MNLDAVTVGRFRHFHDLYLQTRDIEGDIVECGVGPGRSLAMLALALKLEGETRKRIWAFDSFEGLPDPTPEDASVRNPKRGQLMYRLDSVRELIQETVRDPQFVSSRVQFIKGFFQDTLDVMQTRRIALLHLDVDLYASYKSCLDSLYQRVTPGGIITFDEYVRGQIKFPGGVRAIVEFFKDRGLEFERDHYTSNYFVRVPATEYDGPKPASEITRKPLARAGAVETPA